MQKGTVALLSGLAGAAIGATAAYFITKKIVTKKMQAECDAQVESVVNSFVASGYSKPLPPRPAVKQTEEKADEEDPSRRSSQGPNIAYKKTEIQEQEYSSLADKYNTLKEEKLSDLPDIPLDPYEITEQEFLHPIGKYDTLFVSYNMNNDRFYTEDGDDIDEYARELVGELLINRFINNGDDEDDGKREIVYEMFVRNEFKNTDINMRKEFYAV